MVWVGVQPAIYVLHQYLAIVRRFQGAECESFLIALVILLGVRDVRRLFLLLRCLEHCSV